MSKRCPNIDSRICANCSYRDTCNVQSGEQLVSWGNVSGDINKQTDLRNMMDELRTAIRQEVLSMKQEALLDNRDRISKLQSILEKRFDDGFAGMLDRIDRAKEDTRLSLLSSLPKFRLNGTRLFLANDGVSYDDGIELKGEQGRAAFTSIVFKAGNDNGLIVAPTGGTFDSPVPAGWSDGIPERTANNPTIYMSKRKFTSDGVGQDSEWSTPVVAYDSQYTDICFHPATQSGATPQAPTRHGSQGDVISTWHDTGNSDDVWMAISYRDMRSNGWSDWSISKIKGENGDTPEFQIDESSGMLQYRFKDNPFSNLAKVVGDNGKTPALKWEGTKLYIASDGENFDNGVELKGAKGDDGMSIENRGEWATNTEYVVGDMVTSPYVEWQIGTKEPAAAIGHFVCIAEHTSSDSDVINTNKSYAGNLNEYEKGLNKTKWELRRVTVKAGTTI